MTDQELEDLAQRAQQHLKEAELPAGRLMDEDEWRAATGRAIALTIRDALAARAAAASAAEERAP